MKTDPLALKTILQILTAEYVMHLLRYVFIAGISYFAFYGWFRGRGLGRKIQSAFPKSADLRREISYSLLSFAVFCGSGLLTVVFHRLGWAHLYFKIGRFGWSYLWFSLV